jgi:hypothetical protein
MSARNLAGILALILSLPLSQCQEATAPVPPPPPPTAPVPAGPGILIPGPDLHRSQMGIEIRPADSIPPGPPGPQIGGGSQTETLTGFAYSPSGERLPGIRVKLFPSGYDPSQPDTSLLRQAVTDDSGRFAFTRLDTAAFYNLIAGQPAQRLWAYAESLQTRPVDRPLTLGLASIVMVDLHSSGTYGLRDSGIAYFPGTDILARCDGSSPARVDSIPAGLRNLILRSRAGWEQRVEVPRDADSVFVRASATNVSISYRPD